MNIVYGVSGEGLGHVFEAIEIASFLRREGHEVKVLTYGDRACDALRPFHPTRIEGLPLYFNARGLSVPATLVRNAHCIPFYLKNWKRLRRELAVFQPDAFLTAYEPFCTLASHLFRKPLVSMDNQNALLYLRRRPPGYFTAFWLAKLATRLVTFGADFYIIKSFEPAEASRRNVRFVAPIIQAEIRQLRPTIGDHVLVYLTKPNPGLVGVLRQIDETFVIYSGDRVGTEGNLIYRPRGPGFLPDLAACKAIIGTTGFSLIADAIHLQKPYFGVPLKGQFEQTLNAFFLSESQLGDFSEEISRERITAFLGQLPRFRDRLSRHQSRPAEQEEMLRRVLWDFAAGPRRRATGVFPALSPK